MEYILLVTDRSSRRAATYAMRTTQFTAVGTADILVKHFIRKWGFPKSLLSDNGRQFSPKLLLTVGKLKGMRTLIRSTHYPMRNLGTERVNHIMAQLPSVVVDKRQNVWDEQLTHVQADFKDSINPATALAPSEVY